ncbi:exonuclease SbcC [Anaerobranca californiensis DSM 14826]|jgi:exonuclease SbcC|uniref:Exonuclease SbcC n=1 Tax=Anaerobranca californiensis DSM 14826 TaxID=1120989 RepID=A0A1M6LK42_9FIRM|nr:AAA family ATPase [Anaerobranca californiensis]SHJ71539.1 exonuclease SbcC [Anaerobranca californiensis DSM 14826]
MKIKEYSCSQFGALKNIKIELKDGLNVILGPNEAGKSTVVEGIYATLFKGSNIKNKTKEDKDFLNRFKPLPTGDFFDGYLSLSKENGEYRVYKRWNKKPESKMELPDGTEIIDEDSIEKHLRKLLNFGENTYKTIIFSKQQDLKRAVDLILKDQTIAEDISTFLRKVVMELDGVSVDKLRETIEKEYKELYERWNVQLDIPESNTRYKKGVGKILEKYYQLEDKKGELKNCLTIEKRLEEIKENLKVLTEEKENILSKLKEYSKIELDISKRAQIEPQITNLAENEKKLKEIALNWPAKEEEYKNLLREKTKIEEEVIKLNDELSNARKIKEKEKLTSLLNKVKDGLIKLKELEENLISIPQITKEELQILEKLKNKIENIKTAIRAGKMQSKILKSTVPVWVTKDFSPKSQYQINSLITAEGYLKIEFEGVGELEIQSGEFDFNQLKEEMEKNEKELKEKLKELKIANIEEGKVNKEMIDKLNKEIEKIKTSIDTLLNGESIQGLEEKVKSLENIKVSKSEEELEKALNEKRNDLYGVEVKMASLKNKLTEWAKEYQSPDKLLDLVIEQKGKIHNLNQLLSQLAPLPSDFQDPNHFFLSLQRLREEEKKLEEQKSNLEKEYYSLERELPEISSEELEEEIKNLQKELQNLKVKGRRLQTIKRVFQEKLEEMDKNSFKPLEDSFRKYLAFLTDNRYQITEIKDNLQVELKKGDTSMPIELLSTGTKDSVALALRLAIIEVLYGENPGIIVLDDCLVDLDPSRKEKGIKLIQRFAEKNQVIFTTCNPQTAEELGGNIIKLG